MLSKASPVIFAALIFFKDFSNVEHASKSILQREAILFVQGVMWKDGLANIKSCSLCRSGRSNISWILVERLSRSWICMKDVTEGLSNLTSEFGPSPGCV